jgi:hypothetical protein
MWMWKKTLFNWHSAAHMLVLVAFPPAYHILCMTAWSSEFNILNLKTWVGGWNSAIGLMLHFIH